MTIYLLAAGADHDAIERRIRAAVADLVSVSNIAEIADDLARKPQAQAYVVIIATIADKNRFAKLIELVSHHRDRMFFILVSDELSASEYKTLIRTGRGDWVSTNADFREIGDIVARREAEVGREAMPATSAERRPAVVALVPSAGGVGNTTLGVEIGIYLKTNKPTRERMICLIDLDFQSSHICDHLDIEPRWQIQEISSNPERLDSQLLDIFVSRHSTSLHVFAAPRRRFNVCDLNLSALDAFFTLVSARYQLILIDLPSTWFAWTSQVIAASDGVLVTGLNTVPGLRQTVETLAAVRETARGQVVAVVNRCERRMFGSIARRRQIENALGSNKIFYVGDEPMALQSVNTGIPMSQNKTYRAIGKDIATIAAFCTSLHPAIKS
jgi:pilus assembly protein CpaE